MMSLETSEGLLEAMGSQALADGSYSSPEEISKNIDNVSLTDVANVRHLVLVRMLKKRLSLLQLYNNVKKTCFFLAVRSQAAKKFVSGKKTMASSGNLVKTPFVDEI